MVFSIQSYVVGEMYQYLLSDRQTRLPACLPHRVLPEGATVDNSVLFLEESSGGLLCLISNL